MDLDIGVARLKLLKADHSSQHYKLEDDLLKFYPRQIAATTGRIECIEKDISMYQEQSAKAVVPQETLGVASAAPAGFSPITVLGEVHTTREPAGKALLEALKTVKGSAETPIGEYSGFKMNAYFDSFSKAYKLNLKGNMSYSVELGQDAFGNLTRINHIFADLPKRLESEQARLDNLHIQIANAKIELQSPFTQEAELAEKEARLARLNAELNIDGGSGEIDASAGESIDDITDHMLAGNAKSVKPSIMGSIRSYNADKPTPPTGKNNQTERE
jgi:hypothetical protein